MSTVLVNCVKPSRGLGNLNQLKSVVGSFCTKVETQESSRLNYLKNLSEEKTEKPAGWDNAKPYESMPGPKAVPILGTLWNFFPGIGPMYKKDSLEQQYYLYETYGEIVRLSDLKLRRNMVALFNPDDIEIAFRNEGVWPIRDSLHSLNHYKKEVRPDIFDGALGLVTSQGEEWYKQRSVINPVMMQPRSAQIYVGSMDQVAQDFIKRMKQLAGFDLKGEMPEDFFHELNKWALESVCVIGLNKRLGLLDDKTTTTDSQQFIKNVMAFFDGLHELDIKPSIWKYYSTPAYKKYIKVLDDIVGFLVPQLKKEAERVKKENKEKPVSEMSILERLLQKDEKIAFSMTFDLLTAGVDTTSRIVSAALYYLAKNPEKQEKLREEMKKHLPKPDSPVTKEAINDMPYLRAVIKETERLAPIGIGNFRTSVKDLVLSGYRIPKGTDIAFVNLVLCHSDKYFPEAKKFVPERWLRGHELSNKDLNPFIYQPFGFGPRSCVGKRLANLEIEVIIAKIIRNFHLDWPHEDMKWTVTLFYGVGSPLKFHVTPVQS